MNPIIKEKWVSALRSGEYRQGRCALRTEDDEYCCLGVLADLYVQEHDESWERVGSLYKLGGHGGALSDSVIEWAGLDCNDCANRMVKVNNTCLSYLNDCDELSFSQIADVIEAEL